MHEIVFMEIEENKEYEQIIQKVLKKCYEVESMDDSKLAVSVTLTTPEKIKELNKYYRDIDMETDVLSFPMFEKEELDNIKFENEEVLGDMVISIEQVKKQAIEYGHSFERELAYMVVHSFYHLLGYDHIKEEDKKIMRQKEEFVLENLHILR